MSDIYTPSDASSNVAPTVRVASGWETQTGTYTGAVLTPFWGVTLGDEEGDDLTFTVTFDTAFGELIFPNGSVVTAIDNGTIRTYTLMGKAGDLTNIIQSTRFDANDDLNNSGPDDAIFTFGVKDADHDTFATAAVTVQLTDGGPPHTAPEISIASGTEVTNAGYLGPDVRPFRGVTLDDAEDDSLTVTISFDATRGNLTVPWGFFFMEERDGVKTYTLSGVKDNLTGLIQNITFDPNDALEGSGPLDTIFTLGVTDGWQGAPITASVTVAMDNGVPPNPPPEIDVVDGTETTTTTYTNPDNVRPFLGMSIVDEGDELRCRVTYDDLYGDLIFPSFVEAFSFTDEVTGFRVFIFFGDASEVTSVMRAVQFDPRDEMSGSGRTTTTFTVMVADSADTVVKNEEVSVVLDDPVDPNAAPANLTLSNTIIDENPAAVVVGLLNADDPDGDALGYVLVDADGNEITETSPFEIQTVRVGSDGRVVHRLVTKTGMQVTEDEFHDVYVQVSDGRGGSVTEMFTIAIKNVVPPNAAPLIVVADGLAVTAATDTGDNVRPFAGVTFDDAEDDSLTVTIAFDPAGGGLVLPTGMEVIPSSDPETGFLTYTFAGKKAALAALMDTLAFDPARDTRSTGTVTTTFTITVQDSSHAPVTNGSVQVVTTITDKNRAPAKLQLEDSAEGVTVAEGATQIGTLSAEDLDGDAIVWFFAQGGNPDGMFVTDGNTIKLAEGKQLDVDGPGGVGFYTIHVKALDGNGGETVKSFVIAVTNVNDNAPATIRLNGQTSLVVAESTRVGDLIGTLTATDADGSSIVSYAMEANAFFEIVTNAETGAYEVRLKAGVDYETAAQRAHVLRITASDGVNTSAPQDITINVTNVNEPPTGLVAEGGLASNLSVPEDAAVGAVIAALSGQDPDAGETFTYTLVTDVTGAAAASHPFFEIVGDKILLKAGLDDDQIGAYDLWVKVTDAGGLSTVRKVTFTVANVDEKPSGLVVTGGTVAEGAPLHTVAAALAGLDPDAGETFTYHLVTDSTGAIDATHALFEIVDNQIRVKAGLDDAQVGIYDLWVKVTDANDLSTVEKVTITVANVNEAPTSLLLSNAVVYESGSSIQIGTLSAADADGDTLRYDLVDANGNLTNAGPFEILTASASGAVRLATKAGIQVSSDETHVVYIKVSDGKGGSLIKDFGITIKDVNVAPTKPTLSNTVVDESDAAIKIGMLNTTDADGDELTYILVDVDGNEVTDKSPFEIQEIRANGVKVHRLATKAGIQVEGDEERDVWIWVSDGKSSVTEKFTITIRDVAYTPTNVAPTLFIASDAANVRVSDLDGPIKPFMGVSFDDAEDDVLTVSVSFDPAGGDLVLTPETWATSVAINPETGAKTYTFTGRKAELAALMDRLSFDPIQQPGNSGAVRTVFKISVKDAVHDAVSDYSLNVVTAITNKNHAPEGVGLNGSLVSENAGAGILVGTLSAHDRDAGDTLVYTLSDDRFYIDGNQLKVKDGSKLDFEAAQSHQITILVSDGVTSVGQTYTINIGDMVETLTGTKGKDLLQGGAGSDVIKAEYGNDTLLGNAGQDFFVFNTKLGTSKTDRKVNFDTIKDFKVVDDSIWLDDKIFKNAALKKLGKEASEANPKQLTSKFFKIGNEAKDKDDYLIYNKKTGVLSYDADGSGSKHKALEFANIGKNLALTSKDFFII